MLTPWRQGSSWQSISALPAERSRRRRANRRCLRRSPRFMQAYGVLSRLGPFFRREVSGDLLANQTGRQRLQSLGNAILVYGLNLKSSLHRFSSTDPPFRGVLGSSTSRSSPSELSPGSKAAFWLLAFLPLKEMCSGRGKGGLRGLCKWRVTDAADRNDPLSAHRSARPCVRWRAAHLDQS